MLESGSGCSIVSPLFSGTACYCSKPSRRHLPTAQGQCFAFPGGEECRRGNAVLEKGKEGPHSLFFFASSRLKEVPRMVGFIRDVVDTRQTGLIFHSFPTGCTHMMVPSGNSMGATVADR